MLTKEIKLALVAGWFEAAGSIPSSGQIETAAILVANRTNKRTHYRYVLLEHAQTVIGGEIRELETFNGKLMDGLYLSKKEWLSALKKFSPLMVTEERKEKVDKLINSIIID